MLEGQTKVTRNCRFLSDFISVWIHNMHFRVTQLTLKAPGQAAACLTVSHSHCNSSASTPPLSSPVPQLLSCLSILTFSSLLQRKISLHHHPPTTSSKTRHPSESAPHTLRLDFFLSPIVLYLVSCILFPQLDCKTPCGIRTKPYISL